MSKTAPNKSLGLTLALVCAALWGASFPLGGVLAGKLDPVVLAIARYAIATLCFVAVFMFSKKHTLKKIQSKKDAILLMAAGISAQAVFFYFTILAYEYTSSGEIGVINGMAPFLTMAAVFVIDKIKPTAPKVFAVVLSLIGAAVIAYDPSNKIQGLNLGHLFALCGVLGFVTYNYILGKFGSDLTRVTICTQAASTSLLLRLWHCLSWVSSPVQTSARQPYWLRTASTLAVSWRLACYVLVSRTPYGNWRH
ncbi:metabolite transporter (DMT) superfamily [Photobacterium aphoticum]|uniref:Metabolite transporter (DMT) superfamily n=1 Tax=Photobacterium aphoticum TaxID=754436 RepID=A0A090RN69_9GAMM|nr:metabolite transporter (DMT) superfamily [Photobacterium aphoticum]